jgi:hypothetical protein
MNTGVSYDAVAFFDGNILVKEMLYPEFEAILDHVVGIHEFRNKNAHAVYLRINAQLKITAAVFFVIDFDDRGNVNKAWNIPLQHLADTAGRGADLGAGQIKLSCRSQCSVSWHQRSLWDPVLEPGDSNTLTILAKAISRNRLGLQMAPAAEPEPAPQPPRVNQSSSFASAKPAENGVSATALSELEARLKQKYQQDLKAHSKILLEDQKLRLSAMKVEAQDQLEKIQSHYRAECIKLNEKIESSKQLFLEEKHKNLQLKKTLDSQADNVKQVRERYTAELEQSKAFSRDQLLELQEKFENEAQAKLDSVTTELKERLDMREVELFYRDEQIKRLNEETAQLRKEKQSLVDGRGDGLLQNLVESGITFVAYQPGVDHLTIPLSDMSKYLESPVDYVAEKCAVDKPLYLSWLAHVELPVCNHTTHGVMCAKPIPKVDKPSRFYVGESDRCAEHNRAANTFSELLKVR